MPGEDEFNDLPLPNGGGLVGGGQNGGQSGGSQPAQQSSTPAANLPSKRLPLDDPNVPSELLVYYQMWAEAENAVADAADEYNKAVQRQRAAGIFGQESAKKELEGIQSSYNAARRSADAARKQYADLYRRTQIDRKDKEQAAKDKAKTDAEAKATERRQKVADDAEAIKEQQRREAVQREENIRQEGVRRSDAVDSSVRQGQYGAFQEGQANRRTAASHATDVPSLIQNLLKDAAQGRISALQAMTTLAEKAPELKAGYVANMGPTGPGAQIAKTMGWDFDPVEKESYDPMAMAQQFAPGYFNEAAMALEPQAYQQTLQGAMSGQYDPNQYLQLNPQFNPSGSAWQAGAQQTAAAMGQPGQPTAMAGGPQPAAHLMAPLQGEAAYWSQQARAAAQKYGIDPDLFDRQMRQESGNYDPAVVSGQRRSQAGATGIAQIMPQYHPGVNPLDPQASLDYAARLMASHLKQYGNYRDALVAYNGGGGAVQAWQSGQPYRESQSYVTNILGGPNVLNPTPVQASGSPQGQPGQTPEQAQIEQLARTGDSLISQGSLTVAQFGQELKNRGYSDAVIKSVCGPIAAAGVARAMGQQVDVGQFIDHASKYGWDQNLGMHGPEAWRQMLQGEAGIDSRYISEGEALAAMRQGQPVAISTSGGPVPHYFLGQGVNDQGQIYVANSGTALRQGSEWMTPDQIRQVSGPPTYILPYGPQPKQAPQQPPDYRNQPAATAPSADMQYQPTPQPATVEQPRAVPQAVDPLLGPFPDEQAVTNFEGGAGFQSGQLTWTSDMADPDPGFSRDGLGSPGGLPPVPMPDRQLVNPEIHQAAWASAPARYNR